MGHDSRSRRSRWSPTGSRPSRPRRVAGALGALALLVAACSGDDGDEGEGAGRGSEGASGDGSTTATSEAAPLPQGYEGYRSDLYADEASWLCRPGRDDDVCARDLDTTVVNADGSTEVERHEPAEDPAVDCFYVYPTVSRDESANSDMEPGEPDEIFVTYNQAARLTATCRVFAPIYRQLTLGMIGTPREPAPGGADPRRVAYEDVLDAFRHYVANDSEGRGFVLVGHSQGAGHLRTLIAEEIDGEPALRDRLVGAYIIGSGVAVPEGEVVGGDFAEVPLCERTGQVGCVVTYASFRVTSPPPEASRFGRVEPGEGVAGCVNPASPEGGRGELQPYEQVDPPEGSLTPGERTAGFADPADAPEITTPFFTTPGLVEAECVAERGFNYLALTVDGDPSDPRVDDITGDLTPEWGMHLIDVNVAMGNIVDLVAAQSEAYTTG
jgi:hypothetical protein